MLRLKKRIVSFVSGTGHHGSESKKRRLRRKRDKVPLLPKGTEEIRLQSMNQGHLESDREIPQVPPRRMTTDRKENAISKLIAITNNKWLSIMTAALKGDRSDLGRLVEIGQLLTLDLERIQSLSHHGVLKEEEGIFYFDKTYRVYDQSYRVLVEPVVKGICQEFCGHGGDEDNESMALTLLTLYLTLRNFARLATSLKATEDLLHIQGSFHNWFCLAVPVWIDIQRRKSKKCIERAINIDSVQSPLPELPEEYRHLKWTSSAYDTGTEFYQIVKMLNDLSSPGAIFDRHYQTEYLDQAIEAVFQCVTFYTKTASWKISEALEMKKKVGGPKYYKVSVSLCRLVHNLRYLTIEMNKSCSTLEGLEERHNQRLRDMTKFMDEQVQEILRPAVTKMQPVISHYLSVDVSAAQGRKMKCLDYLRHNLHRLRDELPPEDSQHMTFQIMTITTRVIRQVILSNLGGHQKGIIKLSRGRRGKRALQSSQRIHCVVSNLVKLFMIDSCPRSDLSVNFRRSSRIGGQLTDLNGLSTAHLIFKLLQQESQGQHSGQDLMRLQDKFVIPENFGLLKIHLTYQRESQRLLIENLSCQRLRTNKNVTPDPYIKIQLIPRALYPNANKLKSRPVFSTRDPTFEESFSLELTREEVEQGGLIHIWVKDHRRLKKNSRIGEAFIPLQSLLISSSCNDDDEPLVQSRELTRPKIEERPRNILWELEKIRQ